MKNISDAKSATNLPLSTNREYAQSAERSSPYLLSPTTVGTTQTTPGSKPDTCKGCPLYEDGVGFVWGDGNDNPKLFLIGEAPGEHEARQSKPFVGGAGRVLNALLAESGTFRSECYVTNVVKCRPPRNDIRPYLPQAPVHCRQYLDRELCGFPDTPICCLGDTALRFTLGHRSITKHRGSVYDWGGRQLIATIHPAALMRDQKLWAVVVSDLSYASNMSEHNLPEDRFVVEPRLTDVAKWFDTHARLGGTYFVDIENPNGALACIGIGTGVSDALCVPYWDGNEWYWQDEAEGLEVTELVYHFLSNPNYYKVFHNGAYDMQVLSSFGFDVQGWVADTMIMHHTVYAEMRHSLAFLNSVYVRGPFYKDMYHSEKEDVEE